MARNAVKVTQDSPTSCKMHEVPRGCLFISHDGQVWIRTFTGAASLVDGDTFTFGCKQVGRDVIGKLADDDFGPLFDVIPLSQGAEVTITQPKVDVVSTWRSSDGTVRPLCEMATQHLVNALKKAIFESRDAEAKAIRRELRTRRERGDNA